MLQLAFSSGGAAARRIVALLIAFSAGAVHAAFRPEKLAAIDQAVAEAIAAKQIPGAVVWVEQKGTTYAQAFGNRATTPTAEPGTVDTIYDVASLTKVVATTTAIMQLVEQDRLELDAPVVRYWADFGANGKDAITVRQLLLHTSGLRAGLKLADPWSGTKAGLDLVCQEQMPNAPGTVFLYSDLNFIVLGELVRRVSGKPLDAYVDDAIFKPLRMSDSGFLPPVSRFGRIAPTQLTDGVMIRGIVHDPTSRRMDGVAGHAGLFTTAADLARFCRMLLNEGELDGIRILKPETVRAMTRTQTDGAEARGLGWDVDSRYSIVRGSWFPAGRSFGHTGWTGTSLWIDPTSRSFVILLSNRVHPDGKGDVIPLRRIVSTLAAEAMGLDGKAVRNGIDVLLRNDFAPLRGLRIGLITNQSGRDRSGIPTIDLLHEAPGVKLVALFSPEHGIRGEADAAVADGIDARTKLPVHSLYLPPPKKQPGQSAADYDLAVIRARAPNAEQLAEVDALVFDIQDIGARFYTYSTTLGASLEAAARAGKKFFVLDRVNPITGRLVEGPVMTRPASFIGFHPVPVRHGMTIGELARLYNGERKFGADLTVIACENWTRDQWFDQTGIGWIQPSPAIRNLNAATLYPGLCLLERTSLSMGRGTLHPFEQVGSPYVDGAALAEELRKFDLPGVRFEAVKFTPSATFYAGPVESLRYRDRECGGIRAVLTDREAMPVIDVGLAIALAMQKLYPNDFKASDMSRLLGADEVLALIEAGKSLPEIKAAYAKGLKAFMVRREPYLLY